jgi:hypothetical protein
MKWGNTHLDRGKKWGKKKFILEHVMYMHISDNEFFTFSFYPWQEKNVKRWSEEICVFSGVKNGKKNSTALRKIRFSTFPFYPWQEKNEKRWSEEIRILTGVKNRKKKEFILRHIMYTHILNTEFFTFLFYSEQEKNEKRWSKNYEKKKKKKKIMGVERGKKWKK